MSMQPSYHLESQQFMDDQQIMIITTDDIDSALDEIRAEHEAQGDKPAGVVSLSEAQSKPELNRYVVKVS